MRRTWRADYEALLGVSNFHTRSRAHFGNDVYIDGSLYADTTDRTRITVGSVSADHTYDPNMSPAHFADAVNSALADTRSNELSLRSDIVAFSQATGKVIIPLSNNAIRGGGVDSTVINTARRDYVFKSITNPLLNGTLSDMTINCQNISQVSAIALNNFTNYRIERVKFKNSNQWFARLGNEPAETTSTISETFTVEDCYFDTHDGIYEMLLAYNTSKIDVNRSVFINKTGSPGAAPTLGLWQKVEYAHIRNSRFENLVGDAIYYGFTANHIRVENCDFINVKKGLHGAIVSDYGKFGTKHVSDISVHDSRFFGGVNSTASEAIQFGAVHDFAVVNTQIESHAKGIKIGFGNDVLSASDGGDAKFPSVRGLISNIRFKDINPLGTNKTLNSPLFFNNGGDFKDLVISKISIQDDNNYLDYAVIFNGKTTATITFATQVSGGVVTGVTLTTAEGWYDTAPTVTITGGGGAGATATATIDADGRVTGFTVTNGGTGYSSAPTVAVQGAKYKNITFVDCDFGGKKVLVNDLAQIDYDTVKFINCRNFDTSNWAAANLDKSVFNKTSIVMRDGIMALGAMAVPAFTTFYIAGATSTFQHNNIRHTNNNDTMQHIMSNFTGKKEVWYKNNTNNSSKKMELDVDTGVLTANGFDANLATDLSTAGLVVKRFTTTQRDALAGVANGSVIYNTSLDKFQGFQAGAWVDFA